MNNKFENKTVLITGSSRGIGLATAKKFLGEGYFVIGTSTSGSSDFKHDNLKIFQLDLSNSESIKTAVEYISQFGKKIDILVNNAGINIEEWEELVLNISKLRKTMEVNLIGTADFTERILAASDSIKHIVNISSRAGALGDQNEGFMPAYKISKTALNMYTRSLAGRLKENGVIVSSLDPDWVKTDMGSDEAPGEPEDAALSIFNLAISKVETGQFWLNGQKRNW